ncbi:MAG: DUF4921 family protein [Candidatus Portnoybacteria bacterium]|nr:DUF4921 family protein [Candidatus Portnoybacteria bacterium]
MQIPDFRKKRTRKGFKNVSELRKDLVSGEWVIIATGRAKRPKAYAKAKRKKFNQPISKCPFEDPQASGNGEPLLIYYEEDKKKKVKRSNKKVKEWSLQVIQNKYPALGPGDCSKIYKEGPYELMDGAGFHEVIITRDHEKHIALLPLDKVEEVVRAYQERYLFLKEHKCVNYISIFHNHGREAGASIAHPHSQLIAIPVLPSDIKRSLQGAKKYYKDHKRCVHCTMLKWEREERRCVFQNEYFIVYAPFVPRTAFELRIYPREHKSNFEEMTDKERRYLAEALKEALRRLYKGLKDPAYNFFIHTAPCDGKDYSYYHWHVEIWPKTAIWAGFELGTGIEISTIEPEEVAKFLRKIK